MAHETGTSTGTSEKPLFQQLWGKLSRDWHTPNYVLRRKAMRYVEGLVASSLYLRRCDSVGKRARTRGLPFIENLGKIAIGDDFNFVSVWVQSHLVSGYQGFLEIGDSVNINFGAAISAHEHVKIGNRVRIGPYAIIMDSDYHTAANRDRRPTAPIVIEDDVWLAGRVSVLKGSRIGKGSVITAGSVVSGEIPAGVVAGGVPARVLRRIDADTPLATLESLVGAVVPESEPEAAPISIRPIAFAPQQEAQEAPPAARDSSPTTDRSPTGAIVEQVMSIVARTFSVDGRIELEWGPRQIPKWDSLGQLNLTLSLEEQFKITISEEQLVAMVDVGQVCRIVTECMDSAMGGMAATAP